MWCTQCHVAFSWRTGEIDHGNIHNPHALAWKRKNGNLGRNLRDVPCGGLPNNHRLDDFINRLRCLDVH